MTVNCSLLKSPSVWSELNHQKLDHNKQLEIAIIETLDILIAGATTIIILLTLLYYFLLKTFQILSIQTTLN